MNKRFKYGRAFVINSDDSLPCITDNLNKKDYVKMIDVVDLLNALNDENEQLRNIIKQKEEEEKLYAKEILRLNELNKQINNFNRLCGGY